MSKFIVRDAARRCMLETKQGVVVFTSPVQRTHPRNIDYMLMRWAALDRNGFRNIVFTSTR